jgi:Ca2+-transporting ATPase
MISGRERTGLTEAEAAERLARDGPNELPSAGRRSALAIAADVVREPMILLLVACGSIYLVLGDLQEALILLASVFVVIGISFRQTQKADRALDALREVASPRALVIRVEGERRIASPELVAGDLVRLAEGDRVPADGDVVSSVNLRVDESVLTGESVPVEKTVPNGAAPSAPDGKAYSGTLVVGGQGVVRVTATGPRSQLGRIGSSLGGLEQVDTDLQQQTSAIVRLLAVGGIGLCGIVVVLYAASRGDWLGGLLAGLALAIAMMPEEFPVILTLFLALGARRISRRNVLVRHMPALEALGAITTLCVDKTGTLTENRMRVMVLAVDGGAFDVGGGDGLLPEEFHRLLEFALLASQKNPFDPMERSINELGGSLLRDTEHLHDEWILDHEYPLSARLLAMSHVWRSCEGRGWVVAAKGAPEAIADLCHLGPTALARLGAEVEALAARGLRVLGVAGARYASAALPVEQHDFAFELVGLVALADPVRATAPAAVAECRRAGIRTVMITGDYPTTARSIARQIGLASPDGVLTGSELDALDDEALAARAGTVDVFARVLPEQKLRLVRALQARGEVVAMTGDGVNDAPALKAADVGVAMGARGTDVAREAADVILVDDEFASITAAIRLGRRIYDNIRKGMRYAVAIHVPIAGMALLAVVLGGPLVLLPVHIVLLELVVDPACSIVFEAEPEEADVMRRPPRRRRARLFDGRTLAGTLLEGAYALLVVCAVFAVTRYAGYDEEHGRGVVFAALLVTNFALILTNRSTSGGPFAKLGERNPSAWAVVGGATIGLVAALSAPPLRRALRVGAPSLPDVGLIVVAGVAALLGLEVLRRFAPPSVPASRLRMVGEGA